MRSIRPWLFKNHAKLTKNEISDPKISPKKIFWRRKAKRPESSETRFGKVSRWSEPCSRSYEKNSTSTHRNELNRQRHVHMLRTSQDEAKGDAKGDALSIPINDGIQGKVVP